MTKVEFDSVGNELPKPVWCDNSKDLINALPVNSFLLAAKTAMSKGNVVIYDAKSKTATICDLRGFITTISH